MTLWTAIFGAIEPSYDDPDNWTSTPEERAAQWALDRPRIAAAWGRLAPLWFLTDAIGHACVEHAFRRDITGLVPRAAMRLGSWFYTFAPDVRWDDSEAR